MGDIKNDFKQLVEKYEAAKAADPTVSDILLENLVDSLYEEAADYWYSSSADC